MSDDDKRWEHKEAEERDRGGGAVGADCNFKQPLLSCASMLDSQIELQDGILDSSGGRWTMKSINREIGNVAVGWARVKMKNKAG